MDNTGSIIIENMSMPQKGKVRVLVLRDDGRCVDEFGNVYKVVPGNRENRQPMYEELIKELREESCGAKTTTWWRAADAIEELQAAVSGYEATTDVEFVKEDGHERIRFVPKWITVTERLPYPGDKVIVAIRDESGDSRYDYTSTGWWSGDGYKFVVEDEFCLWVTHWMPLPTPPKEETE